MPNLIKACGEYGVSQFVLGELSITFDTPKYAQRKLSNGMEAETVKTTEVKEDNPLPIQESLFQDGDEETEEAQDALDDLILTDPALYEELLSESLDKGLNGQ